MYSVVFFLACRITYVFTTFSFVSFMIIFVVVLFFDCDLCCIFVVYSIKFVFSVFIIVCGSFSVCMFLMLLSVIVLL